MRFQRLRLAGFKSFVDPAELRIEDGLTGVVGPNGCGKSNLLEAIRWVMGESSPKSLRGGGMEDVIFAGTAMRPARDFADVSLLLDNSARRAPAAFNDGEQIEVVRRIERGFGSAYRLNGRDVRQKDVQLLFADAATGAHSPALVSQGRVSAIIAAKPTDRRAMLEEAAGIAGLHVRRKDAEVRLRAAEVNLARLGDMLGAMEGQIATLRRQARQAERYRQLSDRIRLAEAMLLFAKWCEAATAADAARAAGTAAEKQVADATNDSARLTTLQTDAAAALPTLRAREGEAAARLQALGQARQALELELTRIEQRQRELAAAHDAALRDLAREATLAEDAAATLARLAEEAETLDRRIGAVRAACGPAAARVVEIEARASDGERALAEAMAAQAEAQARQRAADSALHAAETRLRRAQDELMRLTREAEAIAADRSGEAELASAETGLADAEAGIEAARLAIETADAARIEAEATRDAASATLTEANAQLRALTTERDALARLLATPMAGGGRTMLDAVRVDTGYEGALAAALGDDLSAAVGRVDVGRGWAGSAVPPGDPALPEGVDPLAAHVEAPAELARRLAQIGVVEPHAVPALVGRLAVGQRLVSRDGRLWRWDGFEAHGGESVAAAERLVQRNRLTAIEAELPEVLHRTEAAQAAVATARAAFDAAQAEERAARAARTAAERARDTARTDIARLTVAIERRQSRMEAATAAVARATVEAEGQAAEAQAARAAIADLPDLAALLQATAEARRDVEASRSALAAARAEQAGLDREFDAATARRAAIDRDRDAWAQRQGSSETQRVELETRAAALAEERAALADAPEAVARRQAALAGELHDAEAARRAEADALAEAEAGLRALDAEMRAANERLASAREEKARLSATSEHHELRRAEVGRIAGERFQCPPPLLPTRLGFDEAEATDAEALSAEFERLQLDRERLGPVNLRAETELSELEMTRATSETERAEIETAIARLRGSIGSLNREGRARLLAAFEAVDKHFRELFTTLFGGGAAHLELIESDDPLEAGLEIMAQPPGKKLQSLTLLSGGEQALTAVALIFALFLTNPAPICVLDEVDAPLDDANVERFCDLLDRMTELTDTRFLIVTHNAVTMSRMHRLFGVTMAERGVSQLVSVDLARAELLLAAE